MEIGYLGLRADSLRHQRILCGALARSLSARLRHDPEYVTPGLYLAESIAVRAFGGWLKVRPRSDDLQYVLPRHKAAMAEWSVPGEAS